VLVEQAIFQSGSQNDVTRGSSLQKKNDSPYRGNNQCKDDYG
jgi:hypothetical protein